MKQNKTLQTYRVKKFSSQIFRISPGIITQINYLYAKLGSSFTTSSLSSTIFASLVAASMRTNYDCSCLPAVKKFVYIWSQVISVFFSWQCCAPRGRLKAIGCSASALNEFLFTFANIQWAKKINEILNVLPTCYQTSKGRIQRQCAQHKTSKECKWFILRLVSFFHWSLWLVLCGNFDMTHFSSFLFQIAILQKCRNIFDFLG